MPYLIPALVVLTVGIGLGWSLSRDDSDALQGKQTHTQTQTDSSITHTLNTKLDELILQLENERQKRVALENDLKQLRKLVMGNASTSAEAFTSNDLDSSEGPDRASPSPNPRSLTRADLLEDSATKIQQALISVGMDGELMDRIEQRVEKQEMDQLYLQNQARREGWYGTRRYFDEQKKVDSGDNIYREELGDERYDKFLFETGQKNRVSASSVLSGSPAEKVGIQSNDVIYSYNDKRIFTWGDLTSATAEGDPQQMVRVEVLREGEHIEFYLKRGPLGIRLGSQLVKP